METLLDKLRAMAKVDVKVEVDPDRLRPNEIAVATASTEPLKRLMPWPPARSIDQTLADVLDDKRRMVAEREVPAAASG